MQLTERTELYDEAIEQWGGPSQVLMAAEEMGELTQAICHRMRNNKEISDERIADEIADVRIMLEQLAYLFKIPHSMILDTEHRKLLRLKELLKK